MAPRGREGVRSVLARPGHAVALEPAARAGMSTWVTGCRRPGLAPDGTPWAGGAPGRAPVRPGLERSRPPMIANPVGQVYTIAVAGMIGLRLPSPVRSRRACVPWPSPLPRPVVEVQ